MNNINFWSLAVSIVPTLLLCYYIYSKDRVEKEPPLLLLALFGAGILCCIASHFASPLLAGLVDALYADKISTDLLNGAVSFASEADRYGYCVCIAFACTAAVEELIKWLALLLITHRNRNFNCLFDGIIYSVFVSLGFGVVENVVYCMSVGFDSLLMRLVASVPSHFFYGVIMGCFYTVWHVYRKARKQEKLLLASGEITEPKVMPSAGLLIASIVIPVAVHGLAQFAVMVDTTVMTVCYYMLIAVLYGACFYTTYYLSKKDASSGKLADAILKARHPELKSQDEVSGDE